VTSTATLYVASVILRVNVPCIPESAMGITEVRSVRLVRDPTDGL